MDPQERLTQALVDRYRIQREVGAGGMATVYVAQDLKHDRAVALKVLRPDLAALMGADRFLAEIKTTANLQHPHILPLFDSGEAGGFLYFVMPYIEGESLRSRLNRERQLAVEEAVSIARAVASALDYAHRQGIIHRDIKPENILLHEGEPMVADFGIALAISAAGGGRMTETGLSLGTPHYMSPEQASGDRELDGRSDIYSLGASLYEMLAGEPPFTAPSAQGVVAKILTEEARPVTEERPSVPVNIAAATQRALAKLPADRFGTAAQFAEALANPAFTFPGNVAPQGRGVLNVKGRSLWNPVSLALAATTVLLALVGTWGWLGRTSKPGPGPLHLTLDLGDRRPQGRDDVIVSPDGSAFAFAGVVDDRTFLYARRADEGHFRLLSGTDWGRFPAFSPDGEWIVFNHGYDGSLLKVSLDGGAPLTVLRPGVLTNPVFPQWGDDGTIVFRAADGLYRVSEDGGEPELLLEGGSWAYFPWQLPGGKGVLCTDERAGSIVLLNLETDSVQVLVPEGFDAMYLETGHIAYAHPNGGLFAVPFDLSKLEITGRPTPVLDDVWLFGGTANLPLRAHYSISRNGVLIYGSGAGGALESVRRQLVVQEFTGDTTVVPVAPQDFRAPRWSPDGRSIAYVRSSGGLHHVFTLDVELGTTPRQLTFDGDNTDPAWSPDGKLIAFGSFRSGTDGRDLFVKTVDNDTAAELFLSWPGDQDLRDWPLEESLVFEYGRGARTDLWMTGPGAAREAYPYLESEADLDDIVVSPDGRWAAYQSDETGIEEVYVRRFPEPLQQIPISNGGGQFPRWAPDGRTVYYWRGENEVVDTLFAARVQVEPTFTVLSEEAALVGSYEVEDWDLHPDGDRIVVAQRMNRAGEGGEFETERFLVVVNWFEELKDRMGRR